MNIAVSHRIFLRPISVHIVAGVLLPLASMAQSISPGTGNPSLKGENTTLQEKSKDLRNARHNLKSAPKDADKEKAQKDAEAARMNAAIEANQTCAGGRFTEVRWWLPVNYSRASETKADDASQTNGVTCFFGSTGPVAYVNQVQFLYGFGNSSSSVSADIASLQFDGGFQVSLGSTVTGAAPTSSGQSTQNGQATVPQAVQQIENGGDFYLKGVWPLAFAVRRKENGDPNLTGLVAFVPRLGFNVPGVSAQTTLTESTEHNWYVPIEMYGQYDAIGGTGLFYGDVRSGYQYVQPEFAAAAGLGGKSNFLLTQIAGGIQFNGLIRIGFQKFFGPAQLFNVKQSDFNKVHLVIQFAPNQIKNAKNQ